MRNLVEATAEYRQLLTVIDVPLITKYIPLASIREIVQHCNAQEKRLRRLPAWLMILLCILRGIFGVTTGYAHL